VNLPMMAIPSTGEIFGADDIDGLITHTGSSSWMRITPSGMGMQPGQLPAMKQALL
jgi:hypothetical protein